MHHQLYRICVSVCVCLSSCWWSLFILSARLNFLCAVVRRSATTRLPSCGDWKYYIFMTRSVHTYNEKLNLVRQYWSAAPNYCSANALQLKEFCIGLNWIWVFEGFRCDWYGVLVSSSEASHHYRYWNTIGYHWQRTSANPDAEGSFLTSALR